MHAKSFQSYLTLCNCIDCSPQVPLSMGFSRQEYWRRLPCLPPGDIPNPRIKPLSLMSPELAGKFSATSAQSLSRVRLFATPWTLAHQIPLSVHGSFQARILEWLAISYSRGSSQPRDRTHISCSSCIVGRFFTH